MAEIPVGLIIDLGAARDELLAALRANGRLTPDTVPHGLNLPTERSTR